jgi:hypothetical protein
MVAAWVIWAQNHGWLRSAAVATAILNGQTHTRDLRRAGLYSQADARNIADAANAGCTAGEWRKWAMVDPLGREI